MRGTPVACTERVNRVTLDFILFAATPGVAGPAISIGHGGTVESFDLGWRLEPGAFINVGSWRLTASLPINPSVSSSNVARDSSSLVALGIAGHVTYRLRLSGDGAVLLGAGFEHAWLWSHEQVRRNCREVRACIAGFSNETPVYNAWVPSLRIGIGLDSIRNKIDLGAAFEVILEPLRFNDVPPTGVHGIAVIAVLSFWIGGE